MRAASPKNPDVSCCGSYKQLLYAGAQAATAELQHAWCTISVPPCALTSRSRIQGVRGSKPGNRILRSFSSRIKTFTLEKTAGGGLVTCHAHSCCRNSSPRFPPLLCNDYFKQASELQFLF